MTTGAEHARQLETFGNPFERMAAQSQEAKTPSRRHARLAAEIDGGEWRKLTSYDVRKLLDTGDDFFTAQSLLDSENLVDGKRLAALGLGTESTLPETELTGDALNLRCTILESSVVPVEVAPGETPDTPSVIPPAEEEPVTLPGGGIDTDSSVPEEPAVEPEAPEEPEPEAVFYTITWVTGEDENGGLVEETAQVEEGTLPTYTDRDGRPAEPEREGYIFTGWDPEVTEAAGDATYTAIWTPEEEPKTDDLSGEANVSQVEAPGSKDANVEEESENANPEENSEDAGAEENFRDAGLEENPENAGPQEGTGFVLSLNGGDDVQAERVCLWGRFEKEAEEDTSNSSNEGSIEVLIDREPLPEGETLYLTPDVAASMTINITFPTGSGNKKLIVELLQMLPEMKKWADNPEDAWYYEAVQEATNEHDYNRDEVNVETWTVLKEGTDWAALELGWAANNGAPASKTAAESETPDGV